MKTRLTLMTCLIGALSQLLSWHPVTAQSTLAPRSNQRSSTIVMSDLSRPKMILGVMGAVKTPGVYHFPGDQVTIKQLLEQAGQTTETATGSVRVVRGSYVNMKLFLPSQEGFVLKPSDMLIVESKAPTTQKIIDLSKIRQASNETSSSSNNVQIGLVNLLDYPMLVTLKADDASLRTVFLDLLKQNPNIVQSTQLIEAVARPQNEPITPDYKLKDGAVLVFDPRTVNRNSLPEFPKPFEVKLASHRQPAAEEFIPPALPEITAAPAGMHQQVSHVTEPVASTLSEPSMMLAPPTASGPQPYVRQGDLLDMNIPPLAPTQQHQAMPHDPSQLPQSMSMPNMQQAAGQQMMQQQNGGMTMMPAIASKPKGPQPYVRDRSETPQQPGPMSPQIQAIMAQMASHHGHQMTPEQMQQMQAMQMGNMQMPAGQMPMGQMSSNTPIDLTSQIEQQQRVADPSSWDLPTPDPVSSTEMSSMQAPVQRAAQDNRLAQYDPYDDGVRSDFPRRQFLQNLPENESVNASSSPTFVTDRHDSAEASVTQLVPLPTEDPFDMHKEAYVAQQYRWTAMGIVGLAVICVVTASLWMKFGSRFSLARLVESKSDEKLILQMHSAPAANIVTSSYQPVQHLPLTTYDQLQALIENQLPIVEESVNLVMGQTLYGEPNVSKLFRYDESHVDSQTGEMKLSGPHFKIKQNTGHNQKASGQQTAFNQAPISAPHFKQRPKPPVEKVVPNEEAKISIVPQQPVVEPTASVQPIAEPKMFRFDGPESPIADKAKEKPHHFEVSAQELLERTRAYIKREKQK